MFLLPDDYYLIKRFPQRGRGVMAAKEIAPDTVLGDYLGMMLKISEENEYENRCGNYIMFYNNQASIAPPNPKALGVHLFNHSCSPNCGILPYQKHLIFVALRRIFPPEELTIGYDVEPPSAKDKFHYPCFCDSPICRGTMHEAENKTERWYQYIKRQQKNDFNKLEVPYGQTVKPLNHYPQTLKDTFGHDLFGSLTQKPAIMRDSKMPSLKILQKEMKASGRCLYFPKINYCLFGLMDDLLISAPKAYQRRFIK